jgi:hypothetical protein
LKRFTKISEAVLAGRCVALRCVALQKVLKLRQDATTTQEGFFETRSFHEAAVAAYDDDFNLARSDEVGSEHSCVMPPRSSLCSDCAKVAAMWRIQVLTMLFMRVLS